MPFLKAFVQAFTDNIAIFSFSLAALGVLCALIFKTIPNLRIETHARSIRIVAIVLMALVIIVDIATLGFSIQENMSRGPDGTPAPFPSEAVATAVPPAMPLPALTDVAYDAEAKSVQGRFHGEGATDHQNYKVMLFIYTNNWYVKPVYDAANPGESLSAIAADGRFQINAYRNSPAELNDTVTKVAVLLVPADYEGPARSTDYAGAKAASVHAVEIDL